MLDLMNPVSAFGRLVNESGELRLDEPEPRRDARADCESPHGISGPERTSIGARERRFCGHCVDTGTRAADAPSLVSCSCGIIW